MQLAHPVSRQSRSPPPRCGESGLEDLSAVRSPGQVLLDSRGEGVGQESSSESNPRGGVTFILYTDNAPLTNVIRFYMGNEEQKL